jgi:phenylalanyl-tRNA synthetase beta chain
MKISRNWLQNYFAEPLPAAEVIAEGLTFHAFEIEEIEGDMMDVKVLPDRAAYALSHRGIATEVAAVLDTKIASDPLRTPLAAFPGTESLNVVVESATDCARYSAALVTGVRVAESPTWLKEALGSVGQRSINNVVDATNYVMLNIGQPLHAFDAGKLTRVADTLAIGVRRSREGEKITTLGGEERTLAGGVLISWMHRPPLSLWRPQTLTPLSCVKRRRI